MTLPELWKALEAAGVEITAGGRTGLVATPATALTAEMRDAIGTHRAAMIETLRNEEAALVGHDPFPPGAGGPLVALVGYSRLRQGWTPTVTPLEQHPGGGTFAPPA